MVTLPRTHKPPGGRAKEFLAYINAAEAEFLRQATDGKSDMTKHGVPSFYMEGSDSGKYKDSKPSQSKTTGSKTAEKSFGGINTSSVKTGSQPSSKSYGSTTSNSKDFFGGINTGKVKTQDLGSSTKFGQAPMGGVPSPGISTPNAPGSPLNNPTKINFYNSLNDLSNAVTQRQALDAIIGKKTAPMPRAMPRAATQDFTTPEHMIELNRIKDWVNRDKNARLDPQIPGRLAEAGRPGAGVADLPQRGNTVYKTPAQQGPDLAAEYGKYRSIAGLTAPQANNIPTPRQNPLRNTDLIRTDPTFDAAKDFGTIDAATLSRLVSLQSKYGKPVTVTEGSAPLGTHAKRSQHHIDPLTGKSTALDLSVPTEDRADLVRMANDVGFGGIGAYGANLPNMVHVDTGPTRSWGPKGKAANIAQLSDKELQAALTQRRPFSPDIAMASAAPPPKKTVLGTVAPVFKQGVGAIKDMFADNDIPIPRMKPGIPSTVAPAQGPPMPQQKPMVPSTVAPSNGPPRPQMKPAGAQMANIMPAMGPPPGIVDQTRPQAIPAALPPAAPGGMLAGLIPDFSQTKLAADFTEANKKINTYGGGETVAALGRLAQMFQGDGQPQPDQNAARDAKGGGGAGDIFNRDIFSGGGAEMKLEDGKLLYRDPATGEWSEQRPETAPGAAAEAKGTTSFKRKPLPAWLAPLLAQAPAPAWSRPWNA